MAIAQSSSSFFTFLVGKKYEIIMLKQLHSKPNVILVIGNNAAGLKV